MRAMLAEADLARYAGQFVWLELNYDKAENRAFLMKYGANATPTFFVIDPQSGHVTATQTGAMSPAELAHFLDRGGSGVFKKRQTPADTALMEGDSLLARKPAEAVEAYQKALRLAPPAWSRRDLAEASLAAALQGNHQWKRCAETAAKEATGMSRDATFGRTVVAGMWCLVSAGAAPWTKEQAPKLEPLAEEALALTATVRDHRDELYRTLMLLSLAGNDTTGAGRWGNRWLDELDAIKPVNDEQRSAIDIARVENLQVFGDPSQILPALIASERAMPADWNASLRVAQMENAARNYDEAIVACDRGLSRSPGRSGRSWLLQTKAAALTEKGRKAEAHRTLEEALEAARAIPNQQSRNSNMNRIRHALGRSVPEHAPQRK